MSFIYITVDEAPGLAYCYFSQGRKNSLGVQCAVTYCTQHIIFCPSGHLLVGHTHPVLGNGVDWRMLSNSNAN